MSRQNFAERHPWTLPWWKVEGENTWTLVYIVTVHVLAFAGIAMFPIPGWKVFLWSLSFAAMGALGTTVAYHRALAHRSVKLNPVVEQILIFAAVFNGSGSPETWIANHRNHHAKADTIEDVSSPRHGGFWWAHLRWLYQWQPSPMKKWAPDLIRTRYMIWSRLQTPLVLASIVFGYFLLGWAGLFWIGAIRLAYCLHMQAFVNSLLHLKPGLAEGVDSSQNIWWLGPLQLTAWGENWHGNHHASPASARFSSRWWQVDVGWYVICALRAVGLARNVRVRM
ncbi:MAG: fatty acid desaturase [Acidobacteria bacterium]|nr:fatty acid desaturase [Acidobacteriota bacterium]